VTLLRIPGPVDPHVHLRDLDWSHKATVESETAAALAGGYWAVLDMPNTPPTTTTAARLAAKAEHVAERARCDFGLWFGAHQQGNEAEYAAAAPGAVGLKMYCDQTTGDLLIADQEQRRLHLGAWGASAGTPVAVHAEGATLEAVLALVRELRVRVHACHVSRRDEVAMLRRAKAEGLPVSVGVTPHHLYLCEADAARLGGYGRVKPPLPTPADNAVLWEAVADGTVDVIESDHAPHTRAEKEAPEPAYGLPGLETTLPLMALAVSEGRLDEGRLVELLATNAQRLFGLRPPAGTVTVVDMTDSWVIADAELRCAPGWSPFAGMRVRGRVREVRIRGELAYDGERVLAQPGSGRNVRWP
jgi:dihydroorotase